MRFGKSTWIAAPPAQPQTCFCGCLWDPSREIPAYHLSLHLFDGQLNPASSLGRAGSAMEGGNTFRVCFLAHLTGLAGCCTGVPRVWVPCCCVCHLETVDRLPPTRKLHLDQVYIFNQNNLIYVSRMAESFLQRKSYTCLWE